MKKIVLTKTKTAEIGVVFDHWEKEETKEKACDVVFCSEENPSQVGNIYIGHVRDVVKNIESAFVEIDKEQVGYLSLKNISPVFLCKKNTDKVCEGDNLMIQVVKDKTKIKDAALTTNFSLPGRYLVLTHGKQGIRFSSKIKDEHFKQKMQEKLGDIVDFGIVVRTEAYHSEPEDIVAELSYLESEYHKLIELAKTRQKHYLLKQSDKPILEFIKKQLIFGEECEIVTDNRDSYEAIRQANLLTSNPEVSLRFYEDKLLPLYKLYSLEHVFEEIYSRKIWLKSGAYLVIDYTEAMTVIDVNTGKCERGKNSDHTFLKVNMEAAMEIARQMRIRNLSGIILVDFIDMKDDEDVKKLLLFMREILQKDRIKASAVDVTKLHLMEITRQKTTDRIPCVENIFL